jgi:glycosyltransferase involved in cell wall biosynthesis
MKILQVMAGGKHGGAETAFVDFCIAQHESGEDIEVVTRPNDIRVPQLVNAGIKVHTAPFGGFIDVYTPWKIARIIKSFKPEIVQTWMSRASQKLPAAKKDKPYRVVARLGGYYKIKNFSKVDGFVGVTPDLVQHLIRAGVAEERVQSIPNFAETEKVSELIKRSDFDTPENATVLLALGRLHRAKAFDTLIKAVKDIENIVLWIAGEGPDREKLEAQIAADNLQHKIKLLGWRSDRAALFAVADICVFPSRHEPFGTVFVQAWAQQTPLVTTASQGPAQFVRDGEDGLVVPIDDIAALKAAIERVMDDKDLAQMLVQNGLKRYQNEFIKDICLAAYKAFYNKVLAS